jgi:hypothetical protein
VIGVITWQFPRQFPRCQVQKKIATEHEEGDGEGYGAGEGYGDTDRRVICNKIEMTVMMQIRHHRVLF